MKTQTDFYKESIKKIKELVLENFKNENVTVLFFGSRAKGNFNRYSDIDIAVFSNKDFKKMELVLLREKLENLNIPYKVDVIDLSIVNEDFRKKVLKEGEIWKKN